jgi:predicted DNA-binding transcriptional regulator AlpA
MPLLIRKKPSTPPLASTPPIECDAVQERLRNGASPSSISEEEYRAMGKRLLSERADFISRAATAEMLGITPRTLLRWHDQNFRPKRFELSPGRYGYRRAEVEAWIAEHGQGSHRPRSASKTSSI